MVSVASRLTVAIAWVPAVIGLAACGVIGAGGGPYPAACAGLGFDDRRCTAIVERAREEAGLVAEDVASVDILPPAGDRTVELGGSMAARVSFDLVDGAQVTREVWCSGVGSSDDFVCGFDPHIVTVGGVDMDVPCAGEPPAGCATLPPAPAAEVVGQARPLRVPVLDIPLDHVGTYEVEVGEAGLPDGYLTTRALTLADDRPTSFWIEGGVRLEVRPEDPSRPAVGSRYREPFDGVEPVRVLLVFDVTALVPGAVLQVRDIVVE